MPWNYRVMRRVFKEPWDETSFGIHEVYYDEDGTPNAWTKEEAAPHGETLDGLKEMIQRYAEALDKPVLDFETAKEIETDAADATK